MRSEIDTQDEYKRVNEALPDEFESSPSRCFDDVTGLEDEKDRIRRNVVNPVEKGLSTGFLPMVYVEGVEGCGNTRFAEAIAGEIEKDLSYWHAGPRDIVGDNLDSDELREFYERLLAMARERAPSFVLLEDGEHIISCDGVLREHVEEVRESEKTVVTAVTFRSSSDVVARAESRFVDAPTDESLHVYVGEPGEERWKAIFRERLEEEFGFEGRGFGDLSYDSIYESAGWCPPSEIDSLCLRIRMRTERRGTEKVRQEHVEEAASELREEMERNPLEHTLEGTRGSSDPSDNRFLVEATDVTYDDVGGMDDVIQTINDTTLIPSRYPEIFEDSNLETTNGILLYGPPGNGKTLLARAVANETDRAFLSVRGPELKDKYYGETERLIRELFQEAEDRQPSVVFFDEFDAVAPSRESCTSCQRGPVNMLLTEMDGLEDRGDVLFLAATNRIEDLDRAVLRPGRIGETIEVPPPDCGAREEISEVYLSDLPTDDSVTPEWLARAFEDGVSGAEIEATCRRAARVAIRREDASNGGDAPVIRRRDFETARRNDGGRA